MVRGSRSGVGRSRGLRRIGVLAVVAGFAVFAVPQAFASLYVVNSAADTTGGTCGPTPGPGTCTLRDAVTAAQAPGDTIHFAIGAGGAHTITLASNLPTIGAGVTIDAATQTGYSGNPLIELQGAGTATIALDVPGGRDNVTLRGFVINSGFSNRGVWLRAINGSLQASYVGTNATGTAASGSFGFAAVYVQGQANTVGGTTFTNILGTFSARNVIVGRLSVGFAGASGNTIRGNYIGVDATGTTALGTAALNVDQAPGTAILDNVVASIDVQSASGTNIRRNKIGTNATGTAALAGAPSASGIQLLAAPNTTIGAAGGDGNVISGKSGDGIQIQDSTGVTVKGNRIGTSLDGLTAIPNGADGILTTGVVTPPSATIGGIVAGEGNTIANSAGAGVAVFASAPTGIVIRGNAIHGNGGLGIDLGSDASTPNDTGGTPDVDTGPNGLQNFPVVANAVQSGGSVSVDVVLQSTPLTTFTLDVYVGSAACDARTWIGTTEVSTNSDGFVQRLGLTYTSGAGEPQTVITTATGPEGTSELSACTPISGSPPALTGNGKLAFHSGTSNDEEIWTVDPDGTGLTQLTDSAGRNLRPRWSPDGSRITFMSNRDGNYEIYVMDADGSNPLNVTETPGTDETNPSFSAEGEKILYSTNGSIASIPADGSGTPTTIFAAGTDGVVADQPAESPDGSSIALVDSVQNALWALSTTDSTLTQLTFYGAFTYNPAWSPDGSHIYFQHLDSGTWHIGSVAPDGTNLVGSVVSSGIGPAPSPDGTKIAFMGTGDTIHISNADGSGDTPLPGTAVQGFDLAWQPVAPGVRADFVVDSISDDEDLNALPDGVCETDASECTLRAAIREINASPAGGTIEFAIPADGTQTITLDGAALPSITKPVVIDGTTQRGVPAGIRRSRIAPPPPGDLGIVLDGTTSGIDGLVLGAGSDGSTIRGLSLVNFETIDVGDSAAILVGSNDNLVVGNYIGVGCRRDDRRAERPRDPDHRPEQHDRGCDGLRPQRDLREPRRHPDVRRRGFRQHDPGQLHRRRCGWVDAGSERQLDRGREHGSRRHDDRWRRTRSRERLPLALLEHPDPGPACRGRERDDHLQQLWSHRTRRAVARLGCTGCSGEDGHAGRDHRQRRHRAPLTGSSSRE